MAVRVWLSIVAQRREAHLETSGRVGKGNRRLSKTLRANHASRLDDLNSTEAICTERQIRQKGIHGEPLSGSDTHGIMV